MRYFLMVVALLLGDAVWPTRGMAVGDVSPEERAATARRHGLDTASALESRVRDTPADVLKMFADAGMKEVRPHVLTAGEEGQLRAAFEALPALHRRVLQERLRSVSFLDGMPNTALASSVNLEEPYRLFHFTVRAGIFRESMSEWATKKERTCFDVSGSALRVSIEAGPIDSIVYVLLHEATHVVDGALGITPKVMVKAETVGEVVPTEFTRGIWSTTALPTPAYRDALMQGVVFHDGGRVLPVAKAEEVYQALRRTPFASLYGSHGSADDLAEYLAIYHWTQVLHQPYRITIREEGKEVFGYEPMKSELVRRRFDQMGSFYE